MFLLSRYWYADFIYNKSNKLYKSGRTIEAISTLSSANRMSKNETVYASQLAIYHAKYAIELANSEDIPNAKLHLDESLRLLKLVENKSPYNVKVLKQSLTTYSDLSKFDTSLLSNELRLSQRLLSIAPSDASINYRHAIVLAKTGNVQESIVQLIKTINMKPDYKIAYKLLGYMYEDLEEYKRAEEQYKYVLENIDPNDKAFEEDLQKVQNLIY